MLRSSHWTLTVPTIRVPTAQIVLWLTLYAVIGLTPSVQVPWTQTPGLIGLSQAAAQQSCEAQGLKLDVVGTRSLPHMTAGVVLTQAPPDGRRLVRGDHVAVVVNEPAHRPPAQPHQAAQLPPRHPLPNVSGMDQVRAQSVLGDAHIEMLVGGEEYGSQPRGAIVSQQPAPGSRVASGGQVVVKISAGQTPAAPAVIGLPLWQAALTVQQAGMTVTVDNSNAPGPMFVVTAAQSDATTPGVVHVQVEAPP